jgi:hypothetical protein
MKRGRNQRRRQGPNINRALDSNGPDVRIRGTANQIYDKYLALARDASSSGDRVKAENYLQHAEHYFRVIRAIQPAQTPQGETMDADSEQPSIGEDRMRRRENGEGELRDHQGGDEDDDASAQPSGERQPQDRQPGGGRQPGEQRAEGESGEQRQPREGGERYANGVGQHGGGDGDPRRGRRRRRRPHHQGGDDQNASAGEGSDESEPVDTAAE